MSDGILSRWARRKQAVRAAARAEAQPAIAPAAPAPVPEAVPDTAEAADALADAIARLPKLEDLTAQTDLSPFLRAGIPTALRNAALRRMWSVDPGIRDFVSEAREYAYDWNVPGGVPGLGPMLPTDDIAAMVERVMTGPARVAKPADPDPAAIEPEAAPETVVPEVGAPEPDEAPKAVAHAEGPPAIPSVDPATPFQSPTIVSRLRRHGGAMPG